MAAPFRSPTNSHRDVLRKVGCCFWVSAVQASLDQRWRLEKDPAKSQEAQCPDACKTRKLLCQLRDDQSSCLWLVNNGPLTLPSAYVSRGQSTRSKCKSQLSQRSTCLLEMCLDQSFVLPAVFPTYCFEQVQLCLLVSASLRFTSKATPISRPESLSGVHLCRDRLRPRKFLLRARAPRLQ